VAGGAILAPKLLVVDDDPAVRESFARLLRHHGYAVEESSTGRAAIQQLRTNTYNLAVIDWRLGDMTGLDVAQAMQDGCVLTPWVLVSGYIDLEIARRAGALGAVKAVGYPVDIHVVVTDALKEASSRAHGWSWLPAGPLTDDMTAAERWAALVLRACDSERDPATIPDWATAAGASETTIYATCKVLGIPARLARDFMRILRALRSSAGRVAEIEACLVFHDPRTWQTLLDRAGLHRRHDSIISLEEFLQVQQFVPRVHPGLAALRASITRL
jgi:CheY-like chemotaxis protein